MMGSVDIKSLVEIPVDNNSCSECKFCEINAMWYFYNLSPQILFLFIWWYWSIPEEVRNINMQHILSLVGYPYVILIG